MAKQKRYSAQLKFQVVLESTVCLSYVTGCHDQGI